jgi:hypothetical protein
MAALPLERHATCGTWNYTLYPRQASSSEPAPAAEAGGPARRRQTMLHRLADPRLTAMSTSQLQQLAARLALSQAARAQQRYSQQRGGRARRATGNPRAKPLFGDAARLLLTLLYQRQVCSMNVLADLLEVTATCIGDLVKQTREVLEDHGHHAGVAPARFATPDALIAFLDSDLRPRRTEIIDRLSHPALTGLTRGELHSLTEQLTARQAAQAERLSHQRRGGPRQPRTRGGVFPAEDQQQRTRPAHRPLPKETVHPGCPRQRPRRGQQNRHRQRHPRNLATPPARRPHPVPRADPLSHSGRPPGCSTSHPRHADSLIPYGFTRSATSGTGCPRRCARSQSGGCGRPTTPNQPSKPRAC